MRKVEPREITQAFRLEKILKSSRSGMVFRAGLGASGTEVALKVIAPGAEEGRDACRAAFFTAMEALRALQPACFPRLLEWGVSTDGSAFLAMELVEGAPLQALADAGPERVLPLLLAIVDGLALLARRGVVHANLCPENILAVSSTGSERPALLGFGTAAYRFGPGPWRAALLASPEADGLAAPELRDESAPASADERSDMFSLAHIVCLALRCEVAAAGTLVPHVRLPAAARSLLGDPDTLCDVLARCLRRDPAERPSSLAELRRALGFALIGAARRGDAVPPPPPEPKLPAAAPSVESAAAGAHAPSETPEPREPVLVLPAASVLESPAAEVPSIDTRAQAPVVLAAPDTPSAEPTPAKPPRRRAWRWRQREARAPEPPRRLPPATGARRRRFWLATTVVLVTAAVAVGLIGVVETLRAPAPTRPAAARVEPTAPPTPHAPAPPATVLRLQQAEAALALGKLEDARAALSGIAPDDTEGMTPGQTARLSELRTMYAGLRRDAATRDLTRALATANVQALRDTIDDLTPAELAAFATDKASAATLATARKALALQRQFLRAQHEHNPILVLEQSTELLAVLPLSLQAAQAREAAAAALESEADRLVRGGDFEQAARRLEVIREQWPQRPGLSDRLARLHQEEAAEQQSAAVIAAAEKAEAARVPEQGLALLAAATPSERWGQRFTQTRARLEQLLQQLDTASPTVELKRGFKLEYEKNKAVVVPLHVTDDHGVKSVQFFARVEGNPRYVELPVANLAPAEYTVEIAPGFHQNHTVEIYVAASDHSGHVTRLGTSEAPLKLKRKRWSLFG
jgi:serine/threonine protein kinase